MRKTHATALVATVGGATLAVGRFGGSYGWKVLFANTFRPPLLNPGEISPVVTPANYLAVLRSSFGRFMYGDLALLAFFAVIVIVGGRGSMPRELWDMLLVTVFAFACHALIYPNLELLYFAPVYVITAVCCAASISSPPLGYSHRI